jgi:hypothetical protein
MKKCHGQHKMYLREEASGLAVRVYLGEALIARVRRPPILLSWFTWCVLACGCGARIELCPICQEQHYMGPDPCWDCIKKLGMMRGHTVRMLLIRYLPLRRDAAEVIRAIYCASLR